MRSSCARTSLSLLLACFPLFSAARLVNVTIDDSNPDPNTGASVTYTPSAGWNDGTNCDACTAKPDAAQMFRGTWHDSTFNPATGSNNFPNTVMSARAQFNGTAVYVYCVLARTQTSPTGDSNMRFLIDGQYVASFVKDAPGQPGYDYNTVVYSNNSIPSGSHTLEIRNGEVGGKKTLTILDYIVYTAEEEDDDDSSSGSDSDNSDNSSSGSIATIVAPAVAVPVAVIALAIAGFFIWRRRRNNRNAADRPVIDAYPPASNPGYDEAAGVGGAGTAMRQHQGRDYVSTSNPFSSCNGSTASYNPYGPASSASGSQMHLYGVTPAYMHQNQRLHGGYTATDPSETAHSPRDESLSSTAVGSSSAGAPQDIPAEAPPAYSADARGGRRPLPQPDVKHTLRLQQAEA